MSDFEVRRYRGIVDDVLGGALTFVLEFGVVLGLIAVAFLIAAVTLAIS
jgi:hypothetical protein